MLGVNKLDDNVWDEFGGNDDHIVPYAGDEHKDQFKIQGDRCKKQRQELPVTRRSTDNVNNYDAMDKLCLPTLTQKETMLEKGSWSHTVEGVIPPCDGEPCKEVKTVTSDDTRMSDHCFRGSNIDSSGSELCADDTILGDKCVVEDDSVSQYSLNHMSQADNELSFLDNDGWLDIGNFEDVDRMFRSCDSTFGMGSLNNEEEFCWLSSSHGTEGADDTLKSEFKFSCAEVSPLEIISDYNMDSKENSQGLPTNNSNKKASVGAKILSSRMDVDDGAFSDPSSILSESDIKSGNTEDLIPIEKRKLSKSSEGRIKCDNIENGDTVHRYASLKQYGDVKQPCGTSSSGVTSCASIQKHKLNRGSDSLGSMQRHTSLTYPDYSNARNHTPLLPALSGSRSEHDGHPSPSLKESSYSSNMESSHDHSLEAAALKRNEKREKLYHHDDAQALSGDLKNGNVKSPLPFHSYGSAQQQMHPLENENEGHSEVGGVSIGFSQETDSSNMQETSPISSAVDEISHEATSFRQLQQVMDQLDIRTKLCIRDSLYRLAKSAEQRHKYANGSIGDNVEAGKAMMAQDTSGCTSFMDLETDTNPIDRSIAHLLFHRPSDPSMLPRNDTAPFKSNVMIDGAMINPPVITEKQVGQEESSIEVERIPLGDNTQ
ncbi:hypothetical protein L6164_036318 [Bauhinia variegata]|uniref:Uncharacterized protein n=1 Tax=Bauhinia variegata TaxID=167791 RepID=A0ACB9KGN0_BAUVA|nr:hypothetical protein L6164_036318 [Bauhinia variegata]